MHFACSANAACKCTDPPLKLCDQMTTDAHFKSARSACNCAKLNPCGVVFFPVK